MRVSWTSLTKLDETLRSDVDKNLCGVRTEFNDVRAELQLCQGALQAAATPAPRVATAAGATEQEGRAVLPGWAWHLSRAPSPWRPRRLVDLLELAQPRNR